MRTHNHRCLLAFTSLTSIVSLTLLLAWGPLTPPAGVVTGTAKPLSEVEPRIAINTANTPGDADSLYKITQPGSYYLTGNLTGLAGRHGIEIVASGVTLDLNGFDLVGVPAISGFDGVSATVAGLSNIVVVNGSVRNWGDEGVDLFNFTASNCRVERVQAFSNHGSGISVGTGGRVVGCAAFSNTVNGLLLGTGCTALDCSAYGNSANGITSGLGSVISHCMAQGNAGHGISVSSGSTVMACSSYNNTGSGFSLASGSTITGCSARSNDVDGILCSSQCLVLANNCSGNGSGGAGAGVHATATDNRLEGNTCTGNQRGVEVALSGSIIIRNTCSGNTAGNWDIAVNNVCGPILDRTAPASAAVLGNSTPDSTGSTHPNANFSF